jgi:hypothetical protein
MGTAYDGLNTDRKEALLYTSFFMLHRLLITMVITVAPLFEVQVML